jgi:F-type H+-transporting ATPase subunit b
MDILGLLATAAEEAEGAGFGLNLDILETNVINLAIVLVLLVYVARKFFGGILAERKAGLEAELSEVEEANKVASAALAEQQEKLAQAKVEAERILASAQTSAKASREAILAQAAQDVERMKAAAAQDLSAEEARVVAQLRQRVITLALQKAESQLPQRLDASAQRSLIDRNLASLGGRS